MSDFSRRYRLEQRIAVGGTAEVFHAHLFADDGSQQPVVIKRVLPQFARDERFRRLFLEEACVAVTVSHPNIVRVLDHGELGQTCYIAMERVDGLDLGSLLDRARTHHRPLRPQLVAFVAIQVGEALQFIHDQTSSEGIPLQIIHRDVSPQNILVSQSGDVKLTDFGIAKSAIRRESTVDGTLRGKLDYMAPEQATLGEVDRRADIFALGCVLFEMLHGSPPFRGASEVETLDRIRSGRILLPPEELDAPPALRAVLARALAPDKEQRYQQAGEVVAALREYMAAQSMAELRQELAQLTCELRQATGGAGDDAVDSAVRALLGHDIDGPASGPASTGTTVFGTAPEREPSAVALEPTGSVALQERPRRRLTHLLVALVALLGVAGWSLWAIYYFRASPQQTVRPDGAAGLAARPGPATAVVPRTGSPVDGSTARGADAQPARLALSSQPPGATVQLDHRVMGQTPLVLELPARPVVLRLSRPGYRGWSRRLDPARSPSSLRISLSPIAARHRQSGWLTINSMPWSRVHVDGRYLGNTPLIKRALPAGRHRVELRGPRGELRRRLTVQIKPGQVRALTVDFAGK